MQKPISIIAGISLLSLLPVTVSANTEFSGEWVTDRELSTPLDPFRRIELDIEVRGRKVIIEELYTTGRRNISETYTLDTRKKWSKVPVDMWPSNRHIGATIGGDNTMRIQAGWIDGGKTLQLKSHYILESSQGETPVRSYVEYRLSRDGKRLTRLELRSSRNLPVVHVFNRK